MPAAHQGGPPPAESVMLVGDRAVGVGVLCFGLAVAGYASTFPAIPGQQIGPSLFPVAIGVGLSALGAALAFTGRGAPQVSRHDSPGGGARTVLLLRFLLVIAVLLFYALLVDALGFFLTAFALLSTLMLAFGVRPRLVPLVAALVTFAIHYAFYTLLRVPLPWGVLQPFAW